MLLWISRRSDLLAPLAAFSCAVFVAAFMLPPTTAAQSGKTYLNIVIYGECEAEGQTSGPYFDAGLEINGIKMKQSGYNIKTSLSPGTYKFGTYTSSSARSTVKYILAVSGGSRQTHNADAAGYATLTVEGEGMELEIHVSSCRRSNSGPTKPSPAAAGGAAKISSLVGDAMYRTPSADWSPVTAGMQFGPDDEISTGPDAALTLQFPDGSTLEMKELTRILIGDVLTREDRIKIRVLLKMGEIRARFPPQETIRSDFSIKSPTATCGVRGTVFTVNYDAERNVTTVTTIDGRVEVIPENGSLNPVTVSAGQTVLVTMNKIGPVYSSGTDNGTAPEQKSGAVVSSGPTRAAGPVVFSPMLDGQEMVNANGYRWFELSIQDPKLCQQMCARDSKCKVFTYLRPGTYNDPRARCGVCDGSGTFIQNPGAVSGIKVN